MKFKPLEWTAASFTSGQTVTDSWYSTYAFVGGTQEHLICFFHEGKWHLHFENKDPSEHICSDNTLTCIRDAAQNLHEESIKSTFFEEE